MSTSQTQSSSAVARLIEHMNNAGASLISYSDETGNRRSLRASSPENVLKAVNGTDWCKLRWLSHSGEGTALPYVEVLVLPYETDMADMIANWWTNSEELDQHMEKFTDQL